jgi:tRNA (mo5U34)-methyltransferase
MNAKTGKLVARAGDAMARAGRCIAEEGFGALGRKIARRLRGGGDEAAARPSTSEPAPIERPTQFTRENYAAALALGPGEFDRHSILGPEAYARLCKVFGEIAAERGAALGHPDLARYTWYHTIDLGGGLVTPGYFDHRGAIDRFGFPDDMSGMTALDVGSATGFFSFAFERRGARVTAVDIASIEDWDMPAGADRERTLQEMMEHFGVATVEEVSLCQVTGPFDFCRRALGSSVEKIESRIQDLTLEKVGGRTFDFVFVGDLLEHTFSPLAALSAVAPLCAGTLTLSSMYPVAIENEPVMFYAGGPHRRADNKTWWWPSRRCLEQILQRLGFGEIEAVGAFDGRMTLDVHEGLYRRIVLRARR